CRVGELSVALGEIAGDDRRVRCAQEINGPWNGGPGGFCSGRRDRQRRAGTPTEDAAQLPSLDDSRYPIRRAAQKFAVRSERKFIRAVASEIVRSVESEQAFVQRSVSGIPV